MAYVESFILPVKASDMAAYTACAAESAAIWRDLGALSVIEARAENTPHGELTSFPRAVLAEEGEVVVVAYITFRDRAHRDAAMAAMEADPRMMTLFETMPVDGKRMIWGGFEVIVHESASLA